MIQGQHHCRGEGRNPNSRLVKSSWEDFEVASCFSLSLVPSAPQKRQEMFLSDSGRMLSQQLILFREFFIKKKKSNFFLVVLKSRDCIRQSTAWDGITTNSRKIMPKRLSTG